MASKRPCILSDVLGHQTFIENDLCLSFDLDYETEFIEKISLLRQSEDLQKQLMKKSDRFLQQNLTLKRMTEQTQSIYQEQMN